MMFRTLVTTVLLAVLAAPLLAGDKEDAAKKKEAERQKALELQAKTSIRIFEKEFKSRDKDRRMAAILTLSQVRHDMVIDEIGKKVLNSRDPDARDVGAQVLGDMDFNPDLAGKYLKDALARNEDFPDVLISLVRSIGKLKYKGALAELKDTAKHLNEEKYRWVTVEVVRTFGAIGDPHCLPFLLWMSEYGGHALKWSTGSVQVDTGASGDVDQKAAKAAWQAKYGHVKAKKPPAAVIRTYMQELRKTVKKLTGQDFADATAFRKWLEKHAKELGLDPKNLDKD